jgi:hypothetical protein
MNGSLGVSLPKLGRGQFGKLKDGVYDEGEARKGNAENKDDAPAYPEQTWPLSTLGEAHREKFIVLLTQDLPKPSRLPSRDFYSLSPLYHAIHSLLSLLVPYSNN